ncbi:MAG: HAMP domain-containing protein [Ectothiorhodospiraceae bacterium]|nr:HAMP domain-containing protein [Ectothiorhodospiraceae bacterium]
MRLGLFAKLFLWLWLVMLLIGAAFMITQRYWPQAPGLPSEARMADYAEEIQRLTAEEGMGALFGYLRSLGRDSEVRYLVLRPDMHGPMARRLPAELHDELRELAAQPAVRRGQQGGTRYIAMPVVLRPDATHLLVAVRPAQGLRVLPAWVRLLIAFVFTAGLSAVLAAHLSRPLRRLSEASRRLARGELTARVPDPGAGGDEITELGRDFNAMADRLQGLVESRTQLLSDVSHELRSPLARLQVAVELARRQAGGAADASLDRMERDIERLDELIGQVLHLARLERGGLVPARGTVDLSALVDTCCADAAFEGEHRGRRLQREVARGLVLQGDASLLRSVLDNLLRNALRHTPEGGTVQVTARRLEDQAVISVRDAGPGVPGDQLARIFEPFVRVSSARERESGGHGLGLAIVRRAVEAHGGRVEARNHPEGGLCVTVRLPLQQPAGQRHHGA